MELVVYLYYRPLIVMRDEQLTICWAKKWSYLTSGGQKMTPFFVDTTVSIVLTSSIEYA